MGVSAQTLAAWLAEKNEEYAAYLAIRGPLWVVRFDEPPTRVFCPREGGLVDLAACLAKMRRGHRVLPTTDPGLACVEADGPLERVVAPEPFMPGVMACARRSGLHGAYYKTPEVDKEYITGRKAPEIKEYRF